MEGAKQEGKVLRKSRVTTQYRSVGDKGHTYTLTKHTTRASYQLEADLQNSCIDDDSKLLRSRGIELLDSETPRFEKVSPEQVADYYKSLGDWQNVLPKTDYSYSPVSRFYRKKINGVIPVIPNMSRRNIRSNSDNEINLFCSQNYVYEETHDGGAAGGSNNDTTATPFYPNPTSSSPLKQRSALDRTYSPAKLSYSGYTFDKNQTANRLSSTSSAVSGLSYCWSAVLSLASGTFSVASSPVGAIYGAVRWLTSTTFWSVYWLAFSLLHLVHGSTTGSLITALSRKRHISSTFVHHRTDELKSRLKHNGVSLWKLFFLVLLIALLCAGFHGFVSVNGDPNVSVITTPVSKSYSFVTNLVLNLYELNYSSIGFLLSTISVAGGRLHESVSSISLVQFYHKIVSIPLWPAAFSGDDSLYSEKADTTSPTVVLSSTEIENIFKQWLATTNSDELARKIMASDEFIRFIDEKLKRVQQKSEAKYVEFAHAHGSLTLEHRVSELEMKFSRLETVSAESRKEFEQKLAELHLEMEHRERRLENEIIVALATVLGIGGEINVDELKGKFTSLFASVEEAWYKIERVEAQFAKFTQNSTESFDQQFERTTRDLNHDLRLFVEEMVARKMGEWKETATSGRIAASQADQLEEYVKGVVRKALEVYDADKTGQADYALESSGGIVLSTRCTETKTANAQFSVFGIPLWHTSRSPRTVIQPGVHPGECWPFPGSTGYLVLQLSERIFVNGVTMEHIPRSLAPNGTIDSAPKDFSVWALLSETDPEPELLGNFRFEMDGPNLQYFETNILAAPYQIVELKILSNHGKVDYTCLYRFRVHGYPA